MISPLRYLFTTSFLLHAITHTHPSPQVMCMRARLGVPAYSVGVCLLPPTLMRRLNNNYAGKDSCTDVLSFPFYDSPRGPWSAPPLLASAWPPTGSSNSGDRQDLAKSGGDGRRTGASAPDATNPKQAAAGTWQVSETQAGWHHVHGDDGSGDSFDLRPMPIGGTAANDISNAPDVLDLGDLVLCPRFIREQAGRDDMLFRQFLCATLAHGLLHLIGYTHDTEENAKQVKQGHRGTGRLTGLFR